MYPATSAIEYKHWKIQEILGQGASARVYKVSDGTTIVALKVFDPSIFRRDSEAKERLARQAELVGHSVGGLIQIIEIGEALVNGEAAPAILMQFVDGESLEKPAVQEQLSIDQVRAIISSVAASAMELAKLGIVHRDIKPANIVFDLSTGRTTLLDTGVIRPLEDAVDVSGHAFVGTRRYSPPEFLYRTHQNTEQAWQSITFYQLGATLYELGLRRRPYHDILVEAQLTLAIKETNPSYADISALPADIRRLIQLSLRRNWEARLKGLAWADYHALTTPNPSPLLLAEDTAIAISLPLKNLKRQQRQAIESDLAKIVDAARNILIEHGNTVTITVNESSTVIVCGDHQTTPLPALEFSIHATENEFSIVAINGTGSHAPEFLALHPDSHEDVMEAVKQRALQLL